METCNVENKIWNVSKLVILFKLDRLNFIQALFPILEGNKKLKILFIFLTHQKTISCFVVLSSLNRNKMKKSSFFAENCSNERFNWKTLGIITEESHREHSSEEKFFWINCVQMYTNYPETLLVWVERLSTYDRLCGPFTWSLTTALTWGRQVWLQTFSSLPSSQSAWLSHTQLRGMQEPKIEWGSEKSWGLNRESAENC